MSTPALSRRIRTALAAYTLFLITLQHGGQHQVGASRLLVVMSLWCMNIWATGSSSSSPPPPSSPPSSSPSSQLQESMLTIKVGPLGKVSMEKRLCLIRSSSPEIGFGIAGVGIDGQTASLDGLERRRVQLAPKLAGARIND